MKLQHPLDPTDPTDPNGTLWTAIGRHHEAALIALQDTLPQRLMSEVAIIDDRFRQLGGDLMTGEWVGTNASDLMTSIQVQLSLKVTDNISARLRIVALVTLDDVGCDPFTERFEFPPTARAQTIADDLARYIVARADLI